MVNGLIVLILKISGLKGFEQYTPGNGIHNQMMGNHQEATG